MEGFGNVRSFEQTFSVKKNSEVDIQMAGDITPHCDIIAICELPNGAIVLVDAANSTIKLLSESFQHLTQCKLPSPPFDMCVIGATELALVTTGKVQFYFLENFGLRSEKSIKIHDQSIGIAYFGWNLYVAMKTTLYRYSLDGKIVKLMYKEETLGTKGNALLSLTKVIIKMLLNNSTQKVMNS
ncbi:hypothetical protein DPMN_037676 [Dreissena polymorpha]|uniref:Uncharacterized protein n=1 Tax=Dreissena polymorpha TaxID=45954 RepID=A0A9D4MBE3_DREPO|nr:hypothetical protein DPMN_037676 [Dreissena polymorpha]